MDSLDISSCDAVNCAAQLLVMSRLLLQMAASVASAPTAQSSASSSGSGMSKSSLIYTFAFIGASVVVGLLFLGIIFKYVLRYRMWRAPVRTPLQASAGALNCQDCCTAHACSTCSCCCSSPRLRHLPSYSNQYMAASVYPGLFLQPAQKPGDDHVSDVPNIKEIVIISNPDGYEFTSLLVKCTCLQV